MKTYIRLEQHKSSTSKHKIIRTTTEKSTSRQRSYWNWNDPLYKITGGGGGGRLNLLNLKIVISDIWKVARLRLS